MRHWSEDIVTITSSSNIISFFNKHKHQLDLEDVKLIVDKCEECRLYLNEHSCSYIEQHEVNPNIRKYLEKIK